MLPSDNDGLQLQLPALQAPGAPTVSGTLVFGLGTNDSNPLGPATLLTVDPGDGTLTTTRDGLRFSRSVIDSGSSAYYFPDSTLVRCTQGDPGDGFYCPPTAVAGNATISGANGAQAAVSFTIANADALFREGLTDAAFPDLAGPLPGSGLTAQTFDWGLPFHYGRTVSNPLRAAVDGNHRRARDRLLRPQAVPTLSQAWRSTVTGPVAEPLGHGLADPSGDRPPGLLAQSMPGERHRRHRALHRRPQRGRRRERRAGSNRTDLDRAERLLHLGATGLGRAPAAAAGSAEWAHREAPAAAPRGR